VVNSLIIDNTSMNFGQTLRNVYRRTEKIQKTLLSTGRYGWYDMFPTLTFRVQGPSGQERAGAVFVRVTMITTTTTTTTTASDAVIVHDTADDDGTRGIRSRGPMVGICRWRARGTPVDASSSSLYFACTRVCVYDAAATGARTRPDG